MKIDIVNLYDAESVYAVYVDGLLEFNGDGYHDNISTYIQGWLDGLERAGAKFKEKRHYLTEAAQTKFADNGFDAPQEFPFKKYKLTS